MTTSVDMSGIVEMIAGLLPVIVILLVFKLIIGMMSGWTEEFK